MSHFDSTGVQVRRFRLHPNRHKLHFQQAGGEEDQGGSDRLSGTFTFQSEHSLIINHGVLTRQRKKKT